MVQFRDYRPRGPRPAAGRHRHDWRAAALQRRQARLQRARPRPHQAGHHCCGRGRRPAHHHSHHCAHCLPAQEHGEHTRAEEHAGHRLHNDFDFFL